MPCPQRDQKSIVRGGSLLDGKPGSVLGEKQQVVCLKGFPLTLPDTEMEDG